MDVYYYGSAGWQQAAYHANPYVSPLSEIPHWKSDPMFFPEWKDVLSPYGFLFSEISCGFAWLGGDSRVLTTLLFKLLNAAVRRDGLAGLAGLSIFRRSTGEGRGE